MPGVIVLVIVALAAVGVFAATAEHSLLAASLPADWAYQG